MYMFTGRFGIGCSDLLSQANKKNGKRKRRIILLYICIIMKSKLASCIAKIGIIIGLLFVFPTTNFAQDSGAKSVKSYKKGGKSKTINSSYKARNRKSKRNVKKQSKAVRKRSKRAKKNAIRRQKRMRQH